MPAQWGRQQQQEQQQQQQQLWLDLLPLADEQDPLQGSADYDLIMPNMDEDMIYEGLRELADGDGGDGPGFDEDESMGLFGPEDTDAA